MENLCLNELDERPILYSLKTLYIYIIYIGAKKYFVHCVTINFLQFDQLLTLFLPQHDYFIVWLLKPLGAHKCHKC